MMALVFDCLVPPSTQATTSTYWPREGLLVLMYFYLSTFPYGIQTPRLHAAHVLLGALEGLLVLMSFYFSTFPYGIQTPRLHAAHILLGALANGGRRDLYEQLRAVLNPMQPTDCPRAPPFEEWSGMAGICDHTFCRCDAFDWLLYTVTQSSDVAHISF